MTKSGKAESEKRTGIVLGMILDGFSHAEIVQYCADNFDIKTRQSEKYIQKANDRLRERSQDKIDDTIDWHVEARKRNLQRAIIKKDFRLVKDCLRDLGEIQGMYPKKTLTVETKKIHQTRNEIIEELTRYAELEGLSLEDFCRKEDINLELD